MGTVVNTQQAQAWDGEGGAFWAGHADKFDESVRQYHPILMEAAAITTEDRVLDVGCGAGRTTLDAARRGRYAVGVDLSSAMLTVARRRAASEKVTNVEFVQADAQVHPFEGFDVVVSRSGAMFFEDPAAAFANLARGLRPGGRLAMMVWQGLAANEWMGAVLGSLAAGRDLPVPPDGAPGPFGLADPDRIRSLLTGAGFSAPAVEPVSRPMVFGGTVVDATRFLVGLNGWLLAELDPGRRNMALDNLGRTLREHESADGVTFRSAMWLVTARRP